MTKEVVAWIDTRVSEMVKRGSYILWKSSNKRTSSLKSKMSSTSFSESMTLTGKHLLVSELTLKIQMVLAGSLRCGPYLYHGTLTG
tara:strand:+ start:169 stop:426 length:258 start_codon:yes stop_codon:yes gene_type:complete